MVETPQLTEQVLEDAFLAIFQFENNEEEFRAWPRYMWVHGDFVRHIIVMRNAKWGRSAYLRRRRGWAPK